MSNHRKNILLFMLLPMILFLTGLLIVWLLLGSKIGVLFQEMKFQIVIIVVIFAFLGIGGCTFELKLSKYLKTIESTMEWPINNLAIFASTMTLVFLCFLFGFLQWSANAFSQHTLLQYASWMILGGLGFGEVFLMMFLCATFGKKLY